MTRNPRPPVPKRTIGFLACDVCRTSIPFSDYAGADWPLHRCSGHARPFGRFTVDPPFPLPSRKWATP